MAQLTKRTIMQSYIRLVNKKPLDKLTVKDIVEDCQITRNTFYYHFQDIYDLTAEVFRAEFAAILRQHGASPQWWQMVREIAVFAKRNRAAVLHIFHSSRRDELLRVMEASSQEFMVHLLQSYPESEGIPQEDLQLLAQTLRCAITGIGEEWINKGMKEDPLPKLDRLEAIFGDLIEHTLRNARCHPPQE